ncbi:hypothetical protein NYP18_00940 [Corynebacterium sp. YIM 101645]|uniref:Uncharacterized protein n=1 Tax=Corynebacterium lemuris TaxID=1859292 RepID=A0ABT2FSN4_9CORY|nr:hypothetical protein [Corynebacterium lemuris]MCS5478221.1 hypothetical protein [Corynebacterium lemuris]
MTDYYSLDDTLAGRIAQAGMVGTAVALPDYISSRPLRALATAGIGAGGAALVAVLNSFDEDPDNDPTVMFDQLRRSIGDIGSVPGPGSDTPAGDFSTASPVQTWTVIIGALAVLAALLRVDAALQRRLVAWLGRRGLSRPNTWLGGVAAAVVFAVAEVAHQRRGQRA